jgi:hypothetical protein
MPADIERRKRRDSKTANSKVNHFSSNHFPSLEYAVSVVLWPFSLNTASRSQQLIFKQTGDIVGFRTAELNSSVFWVTSSSIWQYDPL